MKETTLYVPPEETSTRLVGKIKWFDGSLRYGFVNIPGAGDVYIHANNCECNTTCLHEGEIVTIQKKINPRKGKTEAHSLRLLVDEEDVSLLDRCIEGSDNTISIPAWFAKLRVIPEKDAITQISKSRDGIESCHSKYIQHLSATLLAAPEAIWLREKLPASTRIDLCLSLLKKDSDVDYSYAGLLKELVNCIFMSGRNDVVKWPCIPDTLIQNPAFAECVTHYLSKIPDGGRTGSICSIGQNSRSRIQAIINMPPALKALPSIFAILPSSEQSILCWDCTAEALRNYWPMTS